RSGSVGWRTAQSGDSLAGTLSVPSRGIFLKIHLIFPHCLGWLLRGFESEGGNEMHASQAAMRHTVCLACMRNRIAIFVNEEFGIRSGTQSPHIQRLPFEGLDQKGVCFFIVAL